MIFKINYLIVILLAQLMLLVGCGGGSSSSTISSGPVVSSPALVGQNILPIIIDGGTVAGVNYVNGPFVNVTICAPGTSTCQTIDHVLVDTGSTGLRIFWSVLNPVMASAFQPASAGSTLAECAVFASGSAWGTVRLADVQLFKETASSVPIQIMADPAVPASPLPNACPGVSQNSVALFGANGVLGVSTFLQDCGTGCSQIPPPPGWYYTCTSTVCAAATVPQLQQVQNPVARQTYDNNGVIIVLPTIPATGALSVNGYLILGIGTQPNNAMGSGVTSYDLDPSTGNLWTSYNNQTATAPNAFVDSGSNALFFPDATISVCHAPLLGFYCPTTDLPLGAVIQGATNGKTASINFTVANAKSLFTYPPSNTAFNNLAGTSVLPGTFDWGLPFFFGRNVYFAIEQKSTPLGTGPFVAF